MGDHSTWLWKNKKKRIIEEGRKGSCTWPVPNPRQQAQRKILTAWGKQGEVNTGLCLVPDTGPTTVKLSTKLTPWPDIPDQYLWTKPPEPPGGGCMVQPYSPWLPACMTDSINLSRFMCLKMSLFKLCLSNIFFAV